GDVDHTGGSSAALTQVVNIATTTTALVSSANPSVFGQPVTLTATISSSAAGAPTGTVTFNDGSTVLGTGTVNAAGVATFSSSALSLGTHMINAAYGGDASFGASTSTALSQVVNAAGTSTAVTSSSNPALLGASVTFTA